MITAYDLKLFLHTRAICGSLSNHYVIFGSKSWGGEPSNGIATFKYTAKWKLRRKPEPLMITRVKFFQPLYQSPNSFVEIGKNDHAIDGNQVKIVATVVNLSGARKTANVQFKELKENTVLPA
jgi:transketolase C-terminal domain/subunit